MRYSFSLYEYRFKLRAKIAAGVLSFLLLFSSLLGTGFANTVSPLPVNLPDSLCSVDKVIPISAKKKPVIYIQNAHLNYDVQKNIESILDYLAKEKRLSVICVEGASGNIDTSIMKYYPLDNFKAKITDKYVREGIISGVESFAVNNKKDIPLMGVDDEKLYADNIAEYIFCSGIYENVKSIVSCEKAGIENQLIRDTELAEYIGLKNSEGKNTYFERYIRWLFKNIENYGIDISSYKSLAALYDMKRYQEKIDLDTLNKEISEVESGILNNSPQNEDILDLANLRLDFLSGRDGYRYIYRLKELFEKDGGNFKRFENLNLYYYYLISAKEYKGEEFSRESEIAEKRIVKLYLKKKKGLRKVLNKWLDISLLEKIIALRAVPADIAIFRKKKDIFKREFSFLNDDVIRHYLKFYNLAERREKEIVRNYLRIYKTEKFPVLVTGGYHTNGISALLKKKGIPVFVVTPKIKNASSVDFYNKVMSGYNKYFGVKEGERGGTVEVISNFANYSDPRLVKKREEVLYEKVLPDLIKELKKKPEFAELVSKWNSKIKEGIVLSANNVAVINPYKLINAIRSFSFKDVENMLVSDYRDGGGRIANFVLKGRESDDFEIKVMLDDLQGLNYALVRSIDKKSHAEANKYVMDISTSIKKSLAKIKDRKYKNFLSDVLNNKISPAYMMLDSTNLHRSNSFWDRVKGSIDKYSNNYSNIKEIMTKGLFPYVNIFWNSNEAVPSTVDNGIRNVIAKLNMKGTVIDTGIKDYFIEYANVLYFLYEMREYIGSNIKLRKEVSDALKNFAFVSSNNAREKYKESKNIASKLTVLSALSDALWFYYFFPLQKTFYADKEGIVAYLKTKKKLSKEDTAEIGDFLKALNDMAESKELEFVRERKLFFPNDRIAKIVANILDKNGFKKGIKNYLLLTDKDKIPHLFNLVEVCGCDFLIVPARFADGKVAVIPYEYKYIKDSGLISLYNGSIITRELWKNDVPVLEKNSVDEVFDSTVGDLRNINIHKKLLKNENGYVKFNIFTALGFASAYIFGFFVDMFLGNAKSMLDYAVFTLAVTFIAASVMLLYSSYGRRISLDNENMNNMENITSFNVGLLLGSFLHTATVGAIFFLGNITKSDNSVKLDQFVTERLSLRMRDFKSKNEYEENTINLLERIVDQEQFLFTDISEANRIEIMKRIFNFVGDKKTFLTSMGLYNKFLKSDDSKRFFILHTIVSSLCEKKDETYFLIANKMADKILKELRAKKLVIREIEYLLDDFSPQVVSDDKVESSKFYYRIMQIFAKSQYSLAMINKNDDSDDSLKKAIASLKKLLYLTSDRETKKDIMKMIVISYIHILFNNKNNIKKLMRYKEDIEEVLSLLDPESMEYEIAYTYFQIPFVLALPEKAKEYALSQNMRKLKKHRIFSVLSKSEILELWGNPVNMYRVAARKSGWSEKIIENGYARLFPESAIKDGTYKLKENLYLIYSDYVNISIILGDYERVEILLKYLVKNNLKFENVLQKFHEPMIEVLEYDSDNLTKLFKRMLDKKDKKVRKYFLSYIRNRMEKKELAPIYEKILYEDNDMEMLRVLSDINIEPNLERVSGIIDGLLANYMRHIKDNKNKKQNNNKKKNKGSNKKGKKRKRVEIPDVELLIKLRDPDILADLIDGYMENRKHIGEKFCNKFKKAVNTAVDIGGMKSVNMLFDLEEGFNIYTGDELAAYCKIVDKEYIFHKKKEYFKKGISVCDGLKFYIDEKGRGVFSVDKEFNVKSLNKEVFSDFLRLLVIVNKTNEFILDETDFSDTELLIIEDDIDEFLNRLNEETLKIDFSETKSIFSKLTLIKLMRAFLVKEDEEIRKRVAGEIFNIFEIDKEKRKFLLNLLVSSAEDIRLGQYAKNTALALSKEFIWKIIKGKKEVGNELLLQLREAGVFEYKKLFIFYDEKAEDVEKNKIISFLRKLFNKDVDIEFVLFDRNSLNHDMLLPKYDSDKYSRIIVFENNGLSAFDRYVRKIAANADLGKIRIVSGRKEIKWIDYFEAGAILNDIDTLFTYKNGKRILSEEAVRKIKFGLLALNSEVNMKNIIKSITSTGCFPALSFTDSIKEAIRAVKNYEKIKVYA